MSVSRFFRWMSLVAASAAALLLTAAPALAQFSVDRTQVRLSGRAQSALIKLTNDSKQQMRFDVKIFAWDQDAAGAEKLTATTEAVAAPAAITLAAGQSQNIRIGSTAPAGAREKTYRIVIEELPQPRSAGAGATVAMRMRLNIPVFLEPTAGAAKADLGTPAVAARVPSVSVANTGTVHLQVDSVAFKGVNASGQAAFDVTAGGGYVLAGKTIKMAAGAVTAAQCRAATKVSVTIKVNTETITHDGTVASANCGG